MNIFSKKQAKPKVQPDDLPLPQSMVSGLNIFGQIPSEDLTDWLFSEEEAPSEPKCPTILLEPAETQHSMPKTVILGQESRLSECLLWQLHEEYYANMGVNAWDGMVPNFVTSSAYIAEAYAEMVLAFIEDYWPHLDTSEPIYIVEMATGVGRFSHLLLRELETKLSLFSRFKDVQLRYIMTDFTENNVNYWRSHPKLRHFIDNGMLDFAVFRPEDETKLYLLNSTEIISSESVKNPLIAIANYFFDSIRQDVFKVSAGKIYEGLVTLERNLENVGNPNTFPQFSEIKAHYRYSEIDSTQYYDDPQFNAILTAYKQDIKNGNIIVPIGGLRVIRNLQKLSNHNLVLLSSDKSFATVDHMLLEHNHQFAVHGSFSYMVNYDAIGRFFDNEGGHYFHPNSWTASILTVCGIQTRQACPMEHMNYYFSQKMNTSHPISSVTLVLPEEPEGINRLLGMLRLSLADPRAFCLLAPQLLELLPQATATQQHDLIELMEICWDKYFFFRGERNLPYWFAELYFHLNLQDKSLACLQEAFNGYSEFAAEYLFMKGRSYEKLNQWSQAIEMYQQALNLQPEYPQASAALNALRIYHPF